jgi:hypothetical protein
MLQIVCENSAYAMQEDILFKKILQIVDNITEK